MKTFINGYVTQGQMAPMIMFLNGPGANGFHSHLWNSYWNTGYVPTFVADGVNVSAGWNQSTWTNHVNNRLAVPSYLTIVPQMIGNASGGIITYTLTAEQDLGASSLKLYSAIVQSNEIATSAYGVYNGQTLAYMPKVMPCGNSGTVIDFTGPYPQTIQVIKPYTLNPSVHIFDELDLVSFVLNTSSEEAMNASFIDVPDTNTSGVASESEVAVFSGVLSAWPNPTTGAFAVSSSVPQGATGTVEVFDITGRSVEQFNAGSVHNMNIERSGVYFIRLTTSSGEIVRRQIAVIR